LLVHQNGGQGYIARSEVKSGLHLIDSWKVFIPRAGSGSDSFPHTILGKPFLGRPGEISSETYNCIGPFTSEEQARSALSYISTKLFRFLVLLHKPSQDASQSVYSFVPLQEFKETWTDAKLFDKYGITDQEASFISALIRPLEVDNG
jgi:site-specific DNA-methyltransferase (adenine-specific)